MFSWIREKILQLAPNLGLVPESDLPTEGPFDRELRLHPLPETRSQFAVVHPLSEQRRTRPASTS
jgi:hypothetical protein